LSTVYGIVKQHGGMIDVASQPEAGTTFQVYFALCQQSETKAEGDLDMEMPGGNETLLLAEDDDGVRDLTGQFLKRAGYAVIEARDGQEAVDIFRQTPDTIDLLLLDVVMPRLGGREAFASVRQIKSDVATVFFSGYDKGSLHTDFVLDDGVKLIQKPCTPRALLETVRAVLDERAINEE
jgi:two-component system, cell cycle sensor histidine kinase and response regulator CckA